MHKWGGKINPKFIRGQIKVKTNDKADRQVMDGSADTTQPWACPSLTTCDTASAMTLARSAAINTDPVWTSFF